MKRAFILIGGLIAIVAIICAIRYLALFQSRPDAGTVGNPASPATDSKDARTKPVAYSVETVASDLYVPWSLAFTSPTRLLVSERSGAIRVIENGKLLDKPLAEFSEVVSNGEEGLMGLALDPDYAESKTVFACLAYRSDNGLRDKVIRFSDKGDSIADQRTVIDDIPSAANHAGCRLLFMPDKTLLVTTGDSTKKEIAQDKASLGGKILRITRDGSFPADNPFPSSPVWSYGHRNSQGLAYDAEHDILWATEHGPSVIDGPAGGDEINLIVKGGNYGWPLIHHKQQREGLIGPLLEFTPAVAPSGLLYYTGSAFPQFKNSLLFGALKGEGIYHLTVDAADPSRITAFEKLPGVEVGRVRDIIQGPDGLIYFTTSNRDGRGRLHSGDDKVYRLIVK